MFISPPSGIHAVLSISNSALGNVPFAAKCLDVIVRASRCERETTIRSLNENFERAKISLDFQ